MRIVKINKKKIILPVAAVFAAIAVLLTYRLSLSYLIDTEVKDNTITLGNVSLKLDEGEDYVDSSVIAAGGALPKAPKITNTGNKDEYVFIRIAVPVRKVTLLYESETTVEVNEETVTFKEGQPTVKNYGQNSVVQSRDDEIFRTIADGHAPAVAAQVSESTEPNTVPQLEIGYNKGEYSATEGQSKEGWVYLSRELNQSIDGSNDKYDFYFFGYNRRLKYENDSSKVNYHWEAKNTSMENGNSITRTYYMTEEQYNAAFPENGTGSFPEGIPDALKTGDNAKAKWTKTPILDQTVPLFDRIQLKSFIDEELVSTVTNEGTTTKNDVDQYVDIKAYAIQADELGTDALNNLGDGVLEDQIVKTIFGIVERKAGETP